MSKKDLLKEELKRHMQLLEYTFYMEEPNDEDETENLLFDALTLNEQDPIPGEEEETEEVGAEEEIGDLDAGVVDVEDETEEIDEPAIDPFADEGGMEVEDEFADEGDETVEVDVTDIVDKAAATQEEVASLTGKMDELLGKLGDLEGQVSGMDQVINKIEDLEKEIEERNPTPIEKLEMRSMDSFPYSVTLTDFWSDKEGYDVSEEEKEYVITQQDVDDYSDTEMQQSFDYDSTDEDY